MKLACDNNTYLILQDRPAFKALRVQCQLLSVFPDSDTDYVLTNSEFVHNVLIIRSFTDNHTNLVKKLLLLTESRNFEGNDNDGSPYENKSKKSPH